jgi:hypothetical protein
MNANQLDGAPSEHNGVPGSPRTNRLKFLGSLPAKLQASAKESPRATIVAVGAVAFVFGAFVGSRLGRFALAASVPIVISRALDGTLSRDLMRWATGIPEAPPV